MGARIVVDAMGGDYAPEVNIKGALLALGDGKRADGLEVILVGPRDLLLQELTRHGGTESDRLKILQADEVITMDDSAASAVRRKKNSSMHVGMRLIQEKHADAFVSAGNSGAVMTTALMVLGRIQDVERPAIVVKLPTAESFVTILDAGANVDCRASQLFQFAQMGQIYATVVENISNPRIALLSNGSETTKGNELTRETHALLENQNRLNYVGYVEGYDIFRGRADVIICDGFVGNVVLKLAEGLVDTASLWFRKQIKHSFPAMLGAVLMQTVLKRFKNSFDYEPYGAAPLLGVDGMVLISHGRSTEVAISNGIFTAQRAVETRFQQRIVECFQSNGT